ncbi:TPA: hypothetical protein ACUMPZ_001910 [Haemophilus influenzae]
MISIDVGNIRNSTYGNMICNLTYAEHRQLDDLRDLIVRSVYLQVKKGKHFVENIRIDNFDFLQIIITELQMKGFDAYFHVYGGTGGEPRYYTLTIDWKLGNKR